jgi:hypothetical protein
MGYFYLAHYVDWLPILLPGFEFPIVKDDFQGIARKKPVEAFQDYSVRPVHFPLPCDDGEEAKIPLFVPPAELRDQRQLHGCFATNIRGFVCRHSSLH